ncbi:iron-sulfur cluster assembly scaffold protein [Dongia sp. agr-C8]
MSTELYHAELVARAREAFGEGRIATATASVTVDNPLCGDRVTLDLETSDGKVKAIGHEVKGCLLCAAAAATIATFGQDRSPEALRELALAAKALIEDGTAVPERFADLRVFTPVHAAKSRRDCVLLPFEALGKALDAAF